MNLGKIYKAELYKMSKRKVNLILLIPSVLALLMAVAYSSGNLIITEAGQTEQMVLSCLDFLFLVWTLMAGTGLYAVLIMLATAFQFCSEIEQGQIKLMLLRAGKRADILISKLLALLTYVFSSVILLIATIMLSYYGFLAPSGVGSGEFEAVGLSTNSLLLAIGTGMLSFIILILVTYLVSIKCTPFIAFIIGLVTMCLAKAMTQMESLSFMKYTTFSMEGQLLSNPSIETGVLVGFAVVTVATITLLFGATYYRFNKADIK